MSGISTLHVLQLKDSDFLIYKGSIRVQIQFTINNIKSRDLKSLKNFGKIFVL